MSDVFGEVRDVVVVGSGPAGLTAAIYAARADLAPVLIEGELSSTGDQPGGQLMLTTDVENFPGFPDGVLGPELMSRCREQAERFGTEVVSAKVTKVDFSQRPFQLWIGDASAPDPTHLARSVIISTGARALMLEVPNERRLIGHGVSTCATCDGFFFRDQDIAVVGGGDSAIEEALFLAKFARSVTVIHRRDRLRASKILQARAFEHPAIGFRWNTVVTEVLGDQSVTGLQVQEVGTGEPSSVDVTGLFVAIGHRPNTQLFAGQLDLDDAGYIRTGVVPSMSTSTSVSGVFACGDVQDAVYRQAITAAGSGCAAALDAERYLEGLGPEGRG